MAGKKKELSKKKRRQPVPPPTPAATKETGMQSPRALTLRWPDAFAPPRTALFMVAASLVLAALVFGTAALGGFTAVKVGLAQRFELSMPELVSPMNFDFAFVIWGLGTVVLMGLIHPCIGLSLLLVVRSWLDGYTFRGDNVYFSWSVYLLCALWLIRPLLRREAIRLTPLALLFAILLLVLTVTTRHSHQYYVSYQHLWLWVSYGFLFLMVLNITRERTAFGILLAVFMAGMGAQALFSILHFEYILPHMRELVKDPAILRRYFDTDVITPELARRFNVRRAFGSMLYPNALAGYLLLGLPVVFTMLPPCWRELGVVLKQKTSKNYAAESVRERLLVMSLAVTAGVLTFVAVFFVSHFPKSYAYYGQITPIYYETGPLTVFAFLMACAVGLVCSLLLIRYGLTGCWLLLRFLGAATLVPLLSYSFWITYSRGAYLALLVAVIWAAILFWMPVQRLQRFRAARFVSRAAVSGLVVLLLVLCVYGAQAALSAHNAWAQPAGASSAGPNAQVLQEGVGLSMSDLADPASFRLRLGYWRVALRMASDNLFAGVGLGNFAIAYPRYQHIGAGDVREAHNGYLQMFSEAGLAGGLVFAAFWIYFALWGARRIVSEQDRREKLLLLGMYTGISAFCAHAFLDIHFSHPSLMFFGMALAALFCARALMRDTTDAGTEAPAENSTEPARTSYGYSAVAAAMLLLLCICAAAGSRVYAQQLALNRFGFFNVANDMELNRRMRAGRFLLMDLSEAGATLLSGESLERYPRMAVSLVRLFIEDFEPVADFCAFYKPSPDVEGRFLLLEPGESIPDDGLVVARQPFVVRDHALSAGIPEWMDELKSIDSRFPASSDLALYIATWYELLLRNVHGYLNDVHRPDWVNGYLEWAAAAASRNPYNADMRMYYARALVWPVIFESHPEALRDADTYIARSLEQWEAVIDLSPISPGHRYQYAGAMDMIADYYDNHDNRDIAHLHREKAEALRSDAASLQQQMHAIQ